MVSNPWADRMSLFDAWGNLLGVLELLQQDEGALDRYLDQVGISREIFFSSYMMVDRKHTEAGEL